MADPITISVIAAGLGSVAFDIAKGMAGARFDALATQNWKQLRENLSRYRPDANHDLQKAVYLSHLQAALQVGVMRAEQLGISRDSWFPRKSPVAGESRHKLITLSITGAGESQWLAAMTAGIIEKIEETGRKDFRLPAAGENQPLDSLLDQFELLMQPAGAEARAEKLRSELAARAISDLEILYGKPSPEFTALFNEHWYELLCGCFQYHFKNDSKVSRIFLGELMADLYVSRAGGASEAVSFDIVKAGLEKLGGDFSLRFDEINESLRNQSDSLDHMEKDVLLPLLALVEDEQSRIDALRRFISERFDQVEDAVRSGDAHIEEVIRAEAALTREEVREIIAEIRRTSPRGEIAEPVIIRVLTGEQVIVDREVECDILMRELRDPGGMRVIPIVAPGGFGKSTLVTKALRQVTADGRITDPDVRGVLRLDCFGGGINLQRIFIEAGRLIAQSAFLGNIYDHKELRLSDKLAALLEEMSGAGNVWIALDTFEDLLDEDDAIKDREMERFIEACLALEHRARIIITTRELPKLEGKGRLRPLRKVDEGLERGLPEEDAVAYLRSEGEECGLREAPEDLLRAFCRRVHYIPMALNSVVGYLNDGVYPGVTLRELMEDGDLFSDFDRHDAERGLKRLIANQLARLGREEGMALYALAFFGKPVPQEALEHLLPRLELARALNRLYRNKLAALEIDIFETRRYSLHPVISEQALNRLTEHESLIDTPLAESCLSRGSEAYHKASHRLALDLYDCAEAIYRPLVETGNRKELSNDLAMALMNKGLALWSLGRSNDALDFYDQAIDTYKSLVEAGRSELANDLATALMNKAVALENMERWEESLDHYEQAILLREDCVMRMGMEHLLPSLLETIRNRLMTLRDLRRWEEAGADAARWTGHFDGARRKGHASDALTQETDAMKTLLRGLSEEDRSALFASMGERAARLKELMKDDE